MTESCGNCHFWNEIKVSGSLAKRRVVGQCRYKPPRIIATYVLGSLISDATKFPQTLSEDWCGKYEPSAEQVRANSNAYRTRVEAQKLVEAALDVAKFEVGFADTDPHSRDILGKISARISRELPDMDLDIREKAKALAAGSPEVLDLLNWATLDTVLAEAAAR